MAPDRTVWHHTRPSRTASFRAVAVLRAMRHDVGEHRPEADQRQDHAQEEFGVGEMLSHLYWLEDTVAGKGRAYARPMLTELR